MHTTDIRVRFDEVDSMGIVHHPRFLVYFEVARTAYLNDLGLPYARVMESGTHLAVIETGVSHKRPARYDEKIQVVTRCVECGRTRLRFEYEVRRGDELLASGFTRLAAVTTAGKPRRLPTEIRDVLGPEVVSPPPAE